MNKTDLIKGVAEATGVKKADAEVVVNAVFDVITNTLATGEAVKVTGFGGFEVRDTAARKARNPQTGEEIDVPASKKVAFKPAKTLKDTVKGQ